MKYIPIAHSSMHVSQIALGCMRLAKCSIEEVENLVLTAHRLGINFFDHADIYGAGKSETLFGEVLARNPALREQIIIQTKCGIRKGMYDFSKEHILSSVHASLERLQTDYVDVLLLHRPDALMDFEEVKEAFDELYQSGKVRSFGVSNFSAMQINLLQREIPYPLVFNQLQFSLVHSEMIDQGFHVNMKEDLATMKTDGVIEYCRTHQITIQPWSVLQASWKEGTFLDHPNYALLNEVLEEFATKYQVTKSAIAIAWILRHPAWMQPIVGTTNPKHLEEICDASNIDLTREEWYRLYLSVGKKLP